MFYPFNNWWVGYVLNTNIITNPYFWNFFYWQSSKGVIEEQFWTNMWWLPVAMVWNLLTLPLSIIHTTWNVGMEIIFFPIEVFLGGLTIFCWFILNPLGIDEGWWPADEEGWSGDTTARDISETGFVSLMTIIVPRIIQFVLSGWWVNYLILPDSLPSANASPDYTTVSGDSGGGFMAGQMQVIYSDIF